MAGCGTRSDSAAAEPAPGVRIAQRLAAPTIARHGSPSLRARLLERATTGQDEWCQLFSEPSAGSDLASLATTATWSADTWVVTGHKVWTTGARTAHRGLLLARTDPVAPRHHGITLFALDMSTPGIEVRPLRQMDGGAEFNEVVLAQVRISDSDRIGDLHDGWRVAMSTLATERSVIGAGGRSPERGAGPIAEAVRLWRDAGRVDPVTRDRLVRLWCDAEVLRLTNLRIQDAGLRSAIPKVLFAELNQAAYDLCMHLLGAAGMIGFDYREPEPGAAGLVGAPGTARRMFLRSRANSIEGGTSEIQRNVLGERVLGLPADQPRRSASRCAAVRAGPTASTNPER